MVFDVLAGRFFSHVVKGSEVYHCWLWCGVVLLVMMGMVGFG